MKIKILIALVVVALIGTGALVFNLQKKAEKIPPVACSQEAKICPDGSAVGRTGPNCEFAACPEVKTVNPPVIPGKCFVGGCSGEICSSDKGAVSSCIYKEEYACYKTATCERQADGNCGWTKTSTLSSCLNNSSALNMTGYVSGHVTIGPFCPVEQAGVPCPVPSEAYSSRQAVIYSSNGTTIINKATLDANGNYKIALSPGNYLVQIQPAGIGAGELKPFTVAPSQTVTVDFNIDTGIR